MLHLFTLCSLPAFIGFACCCSTNTMALNKGNDQFHQPLDSEKIRGAFAFWKNLLQISSNNTNPLLGQWCMCLLNTMRAYFLPHDVLLVSSSTSQGYFIILTNFPLWRNPDGNCLLKVSLRCWQIKPSAKVTHKFKGDDILYSFFFFSHFVHFRNIKIKNGNTKITDKNYYSLVIQLNYSAETESNGAFGYCETEVSCDKSEGFEATKYKNCIWHTTTLFNGFMKFFQQLTSLSRGWMDLKLISPRATEWQFNETWMKMQKPAFSWMLDV